MRRGAKLDLQQVTVADRTGPSTHGTPAGATANDDRDGATRTPPRVPHFRTNPEAGRVDKQ